MLKQLLLRPRVAKRNLVERDEIARRPQRRGIREDDPDRRVLVLKDSVGSGRRVVCVDGGQGGAGWVSAGAFTRLVKRQLRDRQPSRSRLSLKRWPLSLTSRPKLQEEWISCPHRDGWRLTRRDAPLVKLLLAL
jgi:hypothetical protein